MSVTARRPIRWLLFVAIVVAAASGTMVYFPSVSGQTDSRPNFVVFMTDDQRGDETLESMPKTRRWFARGGVRFTNGFATTPVCCPSRSTTFSGRYTHNHGNLNNQTTTKLDYDATIMKYLQDAGYETGLVGKFLLQWKASTPPPFFDSWALTEGGYYGTAWGTDGGEATLDYSTTETSRQALRILDAFERQDSRPFFLYVATQAPHGPWEPEPRYAEADVGPWIGNPAVAESDRSDKPPHVSGFHVDLREGADLRQATLRTLLSVDDMVDAVMSRLTAHGELGNTVAVFTSDNGFLWGEHGMHSKFNPYSSSIGVPLLVRWPGKLAAGRSDNRLVGNVDVAPSLLAAAGITPALKYPFDGRPFLTASGLATEKRPEAYLEYFEDEDRPTIPAWSSIRSASFQYVEYYDASGQVTFREYYDLKADPWQLTNLLGDGNPDNDPDTSAIVDRLTRYRTCVGTTGEAACA